MQVQWNELKLHRTAFSAVLVLALFTLLVIVLALLTNMYSIVLIPFFLLFIYKTIYNFKSIYYLLLFLMPLSTEMELPGGFSTDFPTELVCVGLMFVTFFYILLKPRNFNAQFFMHPISLAISLHVIWMFFTVYTSSDTYHSIKFSLAKLWYITTYVLLTFILFVDEKDFKKIFWTMLIPFVFAIVWVLIKHAKTGFTFATINFSVGPFFRNKVNYSAFMTMFYPFLVIAFTWYTRRDFKKWFIGFCLLLFLIAIWFTYTRAAYGSLIIAFGFYFLLKWRLSRWAFIVALCAGLALSFYLVSNRHYFKYQPKYEKTVTHREFADLLSATTKGRDVSTMERVYRWVAAKNMIAERPIYGFGPANFYFSYKPYAVRAFRTYVSDNPEKSSTHNYFLLLACEQGLPGMFIFILFLYVYLISAERIYHETQKGLRKDVVLATFLSNIIMMSYLVMNDMIEADKVGPLFFINIGILIAIDFLNKKEIKQNVILPQQ